MQITYYPGLNNNIQTLICNLPNYEFSKQSITIVPGVQTVDDNTLKLLLLTDYFSRLVSVGVIILAGTLDSDPPTYPPGRNYNNFLIIGFETTSDFPLIGGLNFLYLALDIGSLFYYRDGEYISIAGGSPPPSGSTPSLNFSTASNSQYLSLI